MRKRNYAWHGRSVHRLIGCSMAALMVASCGGDSGGSVTGTAFTTPTPNPTPNATPVPTPSPSPTSTPTPTPTPTGPSRYVTEGTAFLSRLSTEFLKDQATTGSSVLLYANSISGTTKARKDIAFLWSQDNMIRALHWGTRVDPATFKPLLLRAVQQTDWYKNPSCGTGYGFRQGQPCYFDDDALLGGTLMDAYLNTGMDQTILDHARAAMNYILTNVDAQGGVPQKPVDKGLGKYYSGPVLRTAVADTEHGILFHDATEIALGKRYYDQVTDPAVQLLLPTGLYRNTTKYIGPGNVWDGTNTGALASSSAQVGSLAVVQYSAGNTSSLAYATQLGDLIANKWVNPNGSGHLGLGGYEVIELFCELYTTTHDEKWYNRAKGIIDYLLDHGRDQGGYMPDGGDSDDPADAGDDGDSSNWDVDRGSLAPPATITLLHQAAATAAILEFAYIDAQRTQALAAK